MTIIRKINFYLIAILLIGFLLRIYNLTFESFWYDEIFSAKIATFSFSEIIRITAIDVHPPLYYILLKIWISIFPNNDFFIRLLSVAFSISSISLVYFYSKKIFNQKIAYFAAILLAFSCLDVLYAKEARMYSLLSLLIIIEMFSVCLFIKTNEYKYLLCHIVSSTLSIYTQNFAFLYLFVSGVNGLIYIIYYKSKIKQIAKFGFSYLAIFLLYLPWLPTLLSHLKGVNQSFWIPKISLFAFGETLFEFSGSISLGIIFLSLIVFYLVKNLKLKNTNSLFIFSWMIIPISIIILISVFNVTSSIYKIRFLVPSLAPFLIIASIALDNLWEKKKMLSIVILSIIVIISTIEIYSRANSYYKERWRDVAKYLESEVKEDDAVVLMVKDEFNKVGGSQILINYYSENKKISNIFTIEDSLQKIDFGKFARIFLIKSHSLEQNNTIDSIVQISHKASMSPEFTGAYKRFSFLENDKYILEAKGISKSIFISDYVRKY